MYRKSFVSVCYVRVFSLSINVNKTRIKASKNIWVNSACLFELVQFQILVPEVTLNLFSACAPKLIAQAYCKIGGLGPTTIVKESKTLQYLGLRNSEALSLTHIIG